MGGYGATSKWGHLGLTRWPFYKTVDHSSAPIWAGRQQAKQLTDRFMWEWVRQDRNYIHLVWGDLGAGKSHTLSYIRHHFLQHPEHRVLPVRAVMPKEFSGFLEVYQAIMSAIDLDEIAELFSHLYRAHGTKKAAVRDAFPYIPDAVTALLQLRSDLESKKRWAETWLRGVRLTRSQMDSLDISRGIKDTNDCVAMLTGVVAIVAASQKYDRILIMLDECQRTWEAKRSTTQKIDVGLQNWHDESSNHLTLVLAYKSGQKRDFLNLLNADIMDRVTLPVISLPLLNSQDALDFVRSICQQCSLQPLASWQPFGEEMVTSVVQHLTAGHDTTPRHLMTAFHAILTEYDRQIVSQGQCNLTVQEALAVADDALRGPFGEDE